MSMRRVSSRPRLVSDADRASQISALDTTENDTNSSSYFLFGQDGDDDDDGNHDSYAEVTLFGEEGERMSVLPAALITGNDEKKSHVVTTRRTSSSTANDKKLMMSSSISDDTLSDYASCCLYQDEDTTTTANTTANTTLNSLRRESNPSLTNLEMSFQKTSLSSNEDEGGMEAAAAAAVAYIDRQLTTSTTSSTSNNNTASCCTKRKRLSQQQQQHSYYYLTPNSSYAELQQSAHTNNMMWYSPLSTTCTSSPVRVGGGGGAASANSIPMIKQPYYQHHPSTTTSSFANTFTTCAPPPTITLLPEETLINISIHLPHNDIRSFGSTCHSIRMVLMRSTCAMETLWMERLRCRFPVVFGLQEEDASNNSSNNSNSGSDGGGSRMMHSSNINFVDEFELPLAAARTGFVGVYDNVTTTNSSSNNINNCRNTVNLPLLIGLLAPRYPQMIDLHGDDLRASFGSGGVPFRSFDMTVPRATTATVASPMMMMDEERDDDVVVSVIQFTGTVGTGDRSIRSDKPFPPNCRSIASSNNNSGSSSSSSSHGSASFKSSLSTWMKNHTPLRSSRGNKRKNGRASQQPTHSMVRDLSPPPPTPRYNNRHFLLTTVPNSNSNLNLPLHSRRGPLQHLPFTSSHSSSQRSPLFRFLSSLSHHCDCVNDSNASSFVDADADDLDDIVEQNRNDDDDEIGVNDYGMMIRHNGNGLLEQCRQKLGYNNKSVENNLRPFVIPTVLSSSSSSPGKGGVTVDVTPGLVAYFEVTIMDQRDEASRTNESNERHVPQQQQQQQQPPHHHHARLPHRGYNLPRPLRRRNVPLGGHRLLFLQHAQNRLLAGQQAAVALNNNVGQQPPPQQQQQQRLHHHDFNDNAPANIRRPHHRQQRHECVAIGLSTLSFNPRSRMPGWDEHSFGYHGDDGGIFHGHGDMLRRYGPSFGPGDTIGCGLDYSTRKIFFVKNGEFLGWAFDNVDKEMVDRGLYPTVGVDTECPVHVNFGKSPFKFDLKEFGREKLYL